MIRRDRKILSWIVGTAIATTAYALTVEVFFPRGKPFWAFFTTWALAAIWHVCDDGFREWIEDAAEPPKAASKELK